MSNRSSQINETNVPLVPYGSNTPFDIYGGQSVTEQPPFLSADAFTNLQIEGMSIYSPAAVPKPTTIEADEILVQFADIYVKKTTLNDSFQQVRNSEKPLGPDYVKLLPKTIDVYLKSEEVVMPSYKPSYFSATKDLALMKQTFHFYAMNIGQSPTGSVEANPLFKPEEHAEYCFGKNGLKGIGATTAFTSGTLKGQISRMRQNKDVATGRGGNHTNKGLSGLKLTADDLGKLMERTLPLPKADSETLLPLAGNLSSRVVVVDDEIFYSTLPGFKKDTKAGMPFRQVHTKGEKVWDTFVAANTFLNQLEEKMQAPAGPKGGLRQLMRDWWFLGVSYVFPKAERYTLVEREHLKIVKKFDKQTKKKSIERIEEKRVEAEKTRNIYSVPFITHMLASLLVDQIEKFGNLNIDNYDTPSLYKWTPFKGGMNRLMKKIRMYMLETKSQVEGKWKPFTMVYADNWYVISPYKKDGTVKFQYSSEDLTKGESNATRDIMAGMVQYILHSFWLTDSAEENQIDVNFDAKYGLLFRHIMPALFVDSVGLIGNMLVRYYGQASGNTYTFLTNHAVTTILEHMWKEKLGSAKLTKEVRNKLMEATGIDFKPELVIEDLESEIDEVIRYNQSIEEYMPFFGSKIETDGVGQRVPKVLKLDLLGYNAVWEPNNQIWVPALEGERSLKSASCPKDFKTENNMVRNIYENIRYNSLILTGLWIFPVIHKAASSMVHKHYGAVHNAYVTLDTQKIASNVELQYDLATLNDPEVLTYLSGIALPPTKNTMLALFTGDPADTPKRAKYRPILTHLDNKNLWFVTPGMTHTQRFERDLPIVSGAWGDDDERGTEYVDIKSLATRKTQVKYAGRYKMRLTPSVPNVISTIQYSTEVHMYNNADKLYLKAPTDEIYANFKNKMTDIQKLHMEEAKVGFDPVTSIVTGGKKKLHIYAPTKEDFKETLGEQNRKYSTIKKNMVRRTGRKPEEYREISRQPITLAKGQQAQYDAPRVMSEVRDTIELMNDGYVPPATRISKLALKIDRLNEQDFPSLTKDILGKALQTKREVKDYLAAARKAIEVEKAQGESVE